MCVGDNCTKMSWKILLYINLLLCIASCLVLMYFSDNAGNANDSEEDSWAYVQQFQEMKSNFISCKLHA